MSKKKKGRLLLVCAQCDSGDIGESWCGYKWAAELSIRYDLTVLTNLFPGDVPPSQQIPAARVIEWKATPFLSSFPRFNRATKPWFPYFYWKARNWIKQNAMNGEFDMIHQITPMALRYPSPCAGLNIPYIIGPVAGTLSTPRELLSELDTQPFFMKLRALDDLRLKYDPLLRKSYEDAQAVICSAPYAAARLSGFKVKRVVYETEVVYEPIPDLAVKQQKLAGELELLFVGRLIRTKGVRDAIRALGLLPDLPGVKLTVVGDGEDLEQCKRECKNLQLEGRVRFVGKKARAELDQLYQNSDAFIFPSFREPTGIVIFEAMAAGLPVIAADYGGPAAIVTAEAGILVPIRRPEEYARTLADAIRKIATNPDLRMRMSTAAVELATELGAWQNKFKRISALYRELSGIEAEPPA